MPGFFFDQTFQGLGFGTLFPAREILVSDIPAGDGKSLKLYLHCIMKRKNMFKPAWKSILLDTSTLWEMNLAITM